MSTPVSVSAASVASDDTSASSAYAYSFPSNRSPTHSVSPSDHRLTGASLPTSDVS